jgi:hypothetical protein
MFDDRLMQQLFAGHLDLPNSMPACLKKLLVSLDGWRRGDGQTFFEMKKLFSKGIVSRQQPSHVDSTTMLEFRMTQRERVANGLKPQRLELNLIPHRSAA